MKTENWTAEEARQYFKSGIEPRSAQLTQLNEKLIKARRSEKAAAIGQIKLILLNLKVDFVTEYRFHPVRKWRFDFAIPDSKIAIEYEGVFNPGNKVSRHTHVIGFSNDCEKYNEAALLGWKVLRFTALHLQNGVAFRQIEQIL